MGDLAVLQVISAVQRDDLPSVVALVESGANPNEENAAGWTPLFFAVAAGNENMVRCLLEAGANPSHQDHAEWTAAEHAYLDGDQLIGDLIKGFSG